MGIGAMGHAVFRAIEIADEFRKRGKIVFMGGYMPSMLPEFVKDHTDSIIIGDAEISYPKLLEDFEEKGKLEKIYNYPVDNLEGFPIPRYELLLEKKITPPATLDHFGQQIRHGPTQVGKRFHGAGVPGDR